MLRRLIPIFIFGGVALASAQNYTAQVVQVPDGDTIQVLHNGKREWIRFNGVDCPESGDPYTTIATETAVQLLQGKTVTIRPYHVDTHRRIVADVFLADGSSPNVKLVRSGHCRWSHRYTK
jgi:micrococcal nuclease